MTSVESVEVQLSKLKIILIATGSFAFVLLCLWLLGLDAGGDVPRRFNPAVVKAVSIAGIGFFGLCGIWATAKVFDNRPGLILDPSGITDNSSGVAAGVIPWSDVRGFAEFETHGQKMLVVLVKDPEKYIGVGNPIRRALNKANFEMVGSPISISSNSLKINYAELVELCMGFYQRYGSDA